MKDENSVINDLTKNLEQKFHEIKKKKRSIKEFRDRDFSEYCEYVVAFKLQELGWWIYQPLADRYIDIVAYRIWNNKPIIRTIQVKGSRLEKEGKQLSYGLTHRPKDLFQDPMHFFIWLFYDENEGENFIILSVSDFMELMGENFFKSMSWRKGNCRIHFSANIKTTKLKKYLNNWQNLTNGGDPNTYKISIDMQETDKFWKSKKATEKWKRTNNGIIRRIPTDLMERIKRKTEVGL